MSVFYEWVDFATYPLDATRIQTREQRLDLTDAVDLHSQEWSPSGGKPALITRDSISPGEAVLPGDNDEFEAMEITNSGSVIIWTKKRVWTMGSYLVRNIALRYYLKNFIVNKSNKGIEKLMYWPRHASKNRCLRISYPILIRILHALFCTRAASVYSLFYRYSITPPAPPPKPTTPP